MLHLHNNYSFTESLVETVIRSLRHSCRSELTRQGTSLETLLNDHVERVVLRDHPCMSPCSRDHTIIRCLGVRRLVSEDSDQLWSEFLAIHRLSDFNDLHQAPSGQVMTDVNQLDAPRELLEILFFRGAEGELPEERNDYFQQLFPRSHDEAIQVLFVI